MTEYDWLASTDPVAMLRWLDTANWSSKPDHPGPLSDRKLRLFACACCRVVWPLLTDERSRRAVEVAERCADGSHTSSELRKVIDYETFLPRTYIDTLAWACAGWQAPLVAEEWCRIIGENNATKAFLSLVRPLGGHVPGPAGSGNIYLPAANPGVEDQLVTPSAGASLLRHIVGNPWRPVTQRLWNATTQMTAVALYEGEPVTFALHDALLEVGQEGLAEHFQPHVECGRCDGAGMVEGYHKDDRVVCVTCSGRGYTGGEHAYHPKGCHVLDIILGKDRSGNSCHFTGPPTVSHLERPS